ncbi:MAG: DUF1232 domain-containing protein [Alistipes sp.]|nr:DUF1232 domain-containing protein [Candidatus Alistipes equi]
MENNISIDAIKEKIKGSELPDILSVFLGKITNASRKIGRVLTRQLLYLYYVLKEGELTSSEKAWVYAALAYVLIPGDFIPRKIFHILGIADDALALGYVIVKIKKRITPQIELKVAMQLDKWFGYEITQEDEQ